MVETRATQETVEETETIASEKVRKQIPAEVAKCW